jgi:ketosteroid isomerase-like protein
MLPHEAAETLRAPGGTPQPPGQQTYGGSAEVAVTPDPIAPSAARHPAEAVELVAQAVSDGDLEAALAQYEPAATLRPWPVPLPAALSGPEAGDAATAGLLSQLMGLRLPVCVRVCDVAQAGDLAVVVSERRIAGVGADGELVACSGIGATVVVRKPHGWRIVADAWCLAP